MAADGGVVKRLGKVPKSGARKKKARGTAGGELSARMAQHRDKLVRELAAVVTTTVSEHVQEMRTARALANPQPKQLLASTVTQKVDVFQGRIQSVKLDAVKQALADCIVEIGVDAQYSNIASAELVSFHIGRGRNPRQIKTGVQGRRVREGFRDVDSSWPWFFDRDCGCIVAGRGTRGKPKLGYLGRLELPRGIVALRELHHDETPLVDFFAKAKSRVDVAADPADGREAGCAGDDGTKWLSPGARAADEPAVPESLEEMTELYVRLTDTEAALAAARRRESEKGLLLTEATRRAERAEADLQTERRLLADGSAREHGLQEQLAALQEGLRLERQRADAESEAMQAERAELRDALAAAQAALSTERQLSRRANDRADEQESRARALETERDLLDARYAAAAEELQGLLRRAEVAPPAEPPVQPSPRGARSAAPLPPGEAALQRRLQRASRPVVAATPPCPPPPVAAGLQGASPARGRTAAGGSSEEGTSASPTALHARGAPWEQELLRAGRHALHLGLLRVELRRVGGGRRWRSCPRALGRTVTRDAVQPSRWAKRPEDLDDPADGGAAPAGPPVAAALELSSRSGRRPASPYVPALPPLPLRPSSSGAVPATAKCMLRILFFGVANGGSSSRSSMSQRGDAQVVNFY
ncbi:unnamed protein product [Prorocentrum cordatum]|uniref:Uncharacterized protein n=1 Tax=Prorocentrum cordatum TaxID=2364126 RepID=A0ABN9S813_9DINO|nr:unnamed protein product [Polarella glacialis]